MMACYLGFTALLFGFLTVTWKSSDGINLLFKFMFFVLAAVGAFLFLVHLGFIVRG